MADEMALFDVEPIAPPPGKDDSATVRRTKRQAVTLAGGWHPLTKLPLHAEAAPAEDRKAAGRRCGNCRFRRVLGHHDNSYPKCLFGADDGHAPHAAHSEASDCRAWWPACREHEWGDSSVPDGMRWVPDSPAPSSPGTAPSSPVDAVPGLELHGPAAQYPDSSAAEAGPWISTTGGR